MSKRVFLQSATVLLKIHLRGDLYGVKFIKKGYDK